jgi:hypothetical protein
MIFLLSGVFIGAVVLYKFDIISEQVQLLISYQRPGLTRWGESFVSTFFFQIHPFITAAALYSLYTALRKKDLRYMIILWLLFIVVVMDIRRIRYVIMVFPMLSLMASYSFQEINNRSIRRFIALCIVVSSVTLAVFAYLPFLQTMSAANLKNAGEYINSLDTSTIEVYTQRPEDPVVDPSVSVPILDLYTDKDITYAYSKDDFQQPWKDIKISSLRFTWLYKNPRYYRMHYAPQEDRLLVIISDRTDRMLPEDMEKKLRDFRLLREFDAYEGIFRHRTIVSIYKQ